MKFYFSIAICLSAALFYFCSTNQKFPPLIQAQNSIAKKKEVHCPNLSASNLTILIIGQSNASNHGDEKFQTLFPSKVVNLYKGECYVAGSPLLGGSGIGGEFATLLADELINDERFRSVVLISAGVGNTSVKQWAPGGTLHEYFQGRINEAIQSYPINVVIWHQGERDYLDGVSSGEYSANFFRLKNSLRLLGVDAPIFIGVSTYCGWPWTWNINNPVAMAQKGLINNQDVYFGVNSDELLTRNERGLLNPCHFNGEGQRKVAKAYAHSIINWANKNKLND